MSKDWSTLDTEKLLRTRQDQHEQTTSAGVGGYAVPLGEPMRPAIPEPKPKKKQKKQEK
jgi:hypothetical protein